MAAQSPELVDGDEVLGQPLAGRPGRSWSRCATTGRALGPLELGQLAGDEPVARADPLVGRQAEADDVDLEQRLADQVVEPLPEQGARPVQARGVDEDQLRVRRR